MKTTHAGPSPADLDRIAALVALRHMALEGAISLATIDQAAALLAHVPDANARAVLAAVDRIPFSGLPRVLLERLPDLIRQCVGVDPCLLDIPRPRQARRPESLQPMAACSSSPVEHGGLARLLHRFGLRRMR